MENEDIVGADSNYDNDNAQMRIWKVSDSQRVPIDNHGDRYTHNNVEETDES